MAAPLLRAEGLAKSYGRLKAVEGCSFELAAGEICGLLGPNGSGKTTLMKLLAGFFAPDSGGIWLEGESFAGMPVAARAKIGYAAEDSPLYPEMTVGEFMDFVARLRSGALGRTERERRAAVDAALDRCGLGESRRTLIGTLSKGFRQRVNIAQAILHGPALLLLDEPESGLDPREISEFRDMLRQLSPGRAILFSSHVLSEVESLCSRLVVLRAGRVVASGDRSQLERLIVPEWRLVLRVKGAFDVTAALVPLGVATESQEDGSVLVRASRAAFATADDLAEAVFDAVRAGGAKLLAMAERESNLEALFRELTEDGGND